MIFDGAVSVSAPFDLNNAVDTITNTYMERYFMTYYKKLFQYSEEKIRPFEKI